MSKIRNSIYGLALGDALGYRTEFLTYKNALQACGHHPLGEKGKKLSVSDDTQMSLYLMQGFKDSYNSKIPFKQQTDTISRAIAQQFLLWLHDLENTRAPGGTCLSSLRQMERNFSVEEDPIESLILASSHNKQSKGSGTVMRSPWIGLLNAKGLIPSEQLKAFCYRQSLFTHAHPTALHTSYLAALLTSKLYSNELFPGQLQEFCLYICNKKAGITGWNELAKDFEAVKYLPKDFAQSKFSDYDPSDYLGKDGKASTVLITAVVLIDNFGHNPLEVLKRSTFSSGDSDTIGAVAGGIIGACYEENIWQDVIPIVEEKYVPWLEQTIAYLEP